VLVLDEIGQESAAPGWLLELLDERYRKRAPTLTTSGLTVEEIEKRYSSGAARRLVQPVGDTLNLFARET
jgi:DNA replication protein DnaC